MKYNVYDPETKFYFSVQVIKGRVVKFEDQAKMAARATLKADFNYKGGYRC